MPEQKHNDAINALKRLERAGDANSETNAKLIDAAKTLLAKIDAESRRWVDWMPEDAWHIPFEAAARHGLALSGEHQHGDLPPSGISLSVLGTAAGSMVAVGHTRVDRKLALALGEAIADGLMESLAEWAESRVQAASSASVAMRRAAEQA